MNEPRLFSGLTDPTLIRLDVDSKISDQLKVRTILSLIETTED